MEVNLYRKYLTSKDLGKKAEAKKYVSQFISSFTSNVDRKLWTKEFLDTGNFGHKVRHEIFREIVFPVLLEGFIKNDPWSLYHLGKTCQNLYSDKSLHSKVDHLSDYDFFKRCHDQGSELFDLRESLAQTVWRGISFSIHEWPSGLLCEADELERDINYLKELDIEGKYAFGIEEARDVLNEYYKTNNSHHS